MRRRSPFGFCRAAPVRPSLPQGDRRERGGDEMTYRVKVEVQKACDAESLPEEGEIRRWLTSAVAAAARPEHRRCEIVVRVVGEEESRELNRRFRGHDRPTNVLAFPASAPPAGPRLRWLPLGDLVLCGPVVEREAAEQGKAAAAHWGHLLVHGALHLLGYDHALDAEAAAMEGLETRILAEHGYPDPYVPA